MKNTSKFLLGLFAFILFSACALFVGGTYQRNRAGAFLHEFASLELGTTTFAEAQDIANRYGAKTSGIRLNDPCSMHDCVFDFVFRNWLLNHLQRQREILLTAGITVKDGHVTSRELDYSILATSGDHQFMYVLFDLSAPENHKGYTIQKMPVIAAGRAHNIEVHLGSNASVEVRRRAYAVNLVCLMKVTGCDSLRDILPTDWSYLEEK